jgi:hypothetical protein
LLPVPLPLLVPDPDELPVLPLLEPVPEPMPPVLEPLPGLPSAPLPGVVVVEVLGEVPPALDPLPVVMPSSFRHFSRSAPTMLRHLLLALPEALLPVLGEVALGRLPLELSLPVALGLEALLLPPAAPVAEPELCARVTPESAKSAAAVAALMSFKVIRCAPCYLLVPELLPEPVPEPLLLPEPELDPPMGLLGDVVLLPPLPDAPPLELLPLEPVAPLEAAPELDLLKCASHSWRDTWPSLFLSTDEKLGVDALEAPLDELGEDELEAPPVALGDEVLGEEELDAPPEALPEDLLSVALGLELEPDAPLEPEAPGLCASATLASANRAAAVALPTTLTNM